MNYNPLVIISPLLLVVMSAISISILNCKDNHTNNFIFAKQEPKIREGGKLVYHTKDGWTIHASFYPSDRKKRPLFISIHMLMSDRSYYPVSPKLLIAYNVLNIDMRGHGDSLLYKNKKTHWRTGKGNIYWGSFEDIRKGIIEIEKLYGSNVDTTKIFLQGSSYSCVLILQYFLKYPGHVKGLIFMSPGDSYGQNILNIYKRMLNGKNKIPVFHVCSSKDFYCNTKIRSMKNCFRRKLKKFPKGTIRLTRFIIEDEHVHGTHFFYTHPFKYPTIIIKWMNSILEKERTGS